ncbi:MAG: hypothetical protein AB7P03_24880 [Kofleriaceae bacterium]
MKAVPRICIAFAAVGLVVVGMMTVGCEQGFGERCQSTKDCTPPLICNLATQTCAKTSGGGIDATVPDAPDDAPIDSPPP